MRKIKLLRALDVVLRILEVLAIMLLCAFFLWMTLLGLETLRNAAELPVWLLLLLGFALLGVPYYILFCLIKRAWSGR